MGIQYPPTKLVFAGFKQERTLNVYASDETATLRFIRSCPILGASGGPGPKLRRGDRQVPEGLYRISFLNPNSRYHLSLRINYPNDDDKKRAEMDGRANLGGDIMIHGGSASIGCLAMGDEAAEDLFVLAADTGMQNITVILTPNDLRVERAPEVSRGTPEWVPSLYEEIRKELDRLPG